MFDPSAHSNSGWALAEDLKLLVAGKLDPDRALATRHAVAEDARSKLTTHYSKPVVMERPPSLPLNDRELAARLKKARMARKQSAEDLEVLADFGDWRIAMWNAEAEGEARVAVLLEALRTYRAIMDTAQPGQPSGVETFFDEVADFLATEWGVKVIDEVPDYWRGRRIAQRAARREDVMPGWLADEGDAPRAAQDDRAPERLDFGRVLGHRRNRDTEVADEERRDDDDE